MPGFELWDVPTLSRTAVDRAAELRRDADALRLGWRDAALLRVDGRGRTTVAGSGLAVADASTLGPEPVPGTVFLGLRGGRHVWAIRVPEVPEPASDLRALGARLDAADAELLVHAVAILNWHDRYRFSAVDGSPSAPTLSGWSRTSTASGQEEFPRTEPAMICLVHDDADRILLGRQRTWQEGRFSVLAGFVEAGESLEACVVREVREEVGIQVTDIRYLGSQPWPFPRSLMIGFSAVADPAEPLRFADGEIAEAGWYTRDQVASALEVGDWLEGRGAPLLLPGPVSIARRMIESWVRQ